MSSSQASIGAPLARPAIEFDSSSNDGSGDSALDSTSSAPTVSVTSGDSILVQSGGDSGGSDSGSILVQSIAQLVKNQTDMVAAQMKSPPIDPV